MKNITSISENGSLVSLIDPGDRESFFIKLVVEEAPCCNRLYVFTPEYMEDLLQISLWCATLLEQVWSHTNQPLPSGPLDDQLFCYDFDLETRKSFGLHLMTWARDSTLSGRHSKRQLVLNAEGYLLDMLE